MLPSRLSESEISVEERGRAERRRETKEERHGEEKEESGKREGKGGKEREEDRSSLLKPPLRKSGLAGPHRLPYGRISKSNVIIKLSPCGPLRQLKACIPIQIVLMKRPAHIRRRE